MPKKGDSRLVDLAARSYFPEPLAAGVRVYEHESQFIHAKTLVCDDDVAIIGTANLDASTATCSASCAGDRPPHLGLRRLVARSARPVGRARIAYGAKSSALHAPLLVRGLLCRPGCIENS